MNGLILCSDQQYELRSHLSPTAIADIYSALNNDEVLTDSCSCIMNGNALSFPGKCLQTYTNVHCVELFYFQAGTILKTPFVKFVGGSVSFLVFLVLIVTFSFTEKPSAGRLSETNITGQLGFHK